MEPLRFAGAAETERPRRGRATKSASENADGGKPRARGFWNRLFGR
jgi:hypothetical protein